NLAPAHERLHFLEANGAIAAGIHRLEDALVRPLKLLKRDSAVSISVHPTEDYPHRHGTQQAATAAAVRQSAAHHSATPHAAVITVVVALVLLLHHRATWSRLAAGTLGTRSYNATAEDSRSCR